MALQITLGVAIAHVRKMRNLTLEDLCKLSCVTLGTLKKIESGALAAPSFPALESIAKALNIRMSSLFILAECDKDKGVLDIQQAVMRQLLKGKKA